MKFGCNPPSSFVSEEKSFEIVDGQTTDDGQRSLPIL